jgi:hypothetical protein
MHANHDKSDATSLEQLLPLAKIARLLPKRRNNRPTHSATLHRWRAYGLQGQKLKCIRVGGTWCTTIADVESFFQALTSGIAPTTSPKPSHCQPQVEAELDRLWGKTKR